MRATIQDAPAQMVQCGLYKMHLDHSKMNMNVRVHHIPNHHVRDTIKRTYYTISKMLDLIIEKGTLSHEDVYFITHSSTPSQITQEISSFLCDKVNI